MKTLVAKNFEKGKCPKCGDAQTEYIASDGYRDYETVQYGCTHCDIAFTEIYRCVGVEIDEENYYKELDK